MSPACPICLKHRGSGPPADGCEVWPDEHVMVFHSGLGFLGHLFVETRRHVGYLADLTPGRCALPPAPSRTASGTPATLRWHEVDQWPDAPHVDPR